MESHASDEVNSGWFRRARAGLSSATCAAAALLLFGLVASDSASAQSIGTFSRVADMLKPRFLHTATALTDGRVLIAGGASSVYGGPTVVEASAELFLPGSGTFVGTSNMKVPRWGHTATLLPDGRVLIVGGYTAVGDLSAELYDPSTGLFAATGNMKTPRVGHRAVLLGDGKVLIVGGVSSVDGAFLTGAELYDPYTDSFTATGSMLEPFADTATVLLNGTVLVTHSIIGYETFGEVFVRHAELYEPSTGTFTATGQMIDFHNNPTATLLRNGDVLIAGGDFGDGDGPSPFAERYDPMSRAFSASGGLTAAREGHTATLLSQGSVLITGGHGGVPVGGGGYDNLASAELYDPAARTFRPSGAMSTGREFHQATLLNSGAVLITGGAEYYPYGAGDRPPVYGLLSSAEVFTPDNTASTPYGGVPWPIPGTIQAENFDEGDERLAYHDADPANNGGQYRNTSVDVEATGDGAGGGHNVGWMTAGEWLKYTVSVERAGSYRVAARVAANGSGGTFHIEFNGLNETGPLTIPDTLGWQNWTDVAVNVTLDAGVQTMQFVADRNGAVFGNVNYISVTDADTSGPSPHGGAPWPIPGRVEAENFDEGGESVAYHDSDPVNNGGQYRSTGVDIEVTGDDAGGYNVGWMTAGESLTYTVSVQQSGTYKLTARVAARGAGGTFHIEFDGIDRTGRLTIPDTGGWQDWVDVTTMVALGSGVQSMRFVADANRSVFGNLNYVMVENATGSTPFGGRPWALPGFVEAEHFDEGLEGVAYHDVTRDNDGGQYRPTGVDIETTTDTGGGQFGAPVGGRNVGWMTAGEWLKYTVSVFGTGTYLLTVRVASIAPGGTFHIEFDGLDRTGPLTIPDTGGWQTWTNIAVEVHLPGGVQVMRLVQDSNGATGVFGNVNWIEVQFEI